MAANRTGLKRRRTRGLGTVLQAAALTSVDEPLPTSALATALMCDNSNVTGIVDRLEALALVERRSAEHDRRQDRRACATSCSAR